MDLISRQDAIDAISKEYRRDDSDYPTQYQLGLSKAIQIIQALPSAEIIRCKDCKKAPKCYGDVLMKSKGGGYIYCPLEYCSEAERKDNG